MWRGFGSQEQAWRVALTVPAIARSSWHLQGPPLSGLHTCPHAVEFIKPGQRMKSVSEVSAYNPTLGPCVVTHMDSPRVP